jgi:phosphoglycerate dehydrogenase-like enzyme
LKWRTLIACPHLQRTIAPYEQLFAEHRIEIEIPGRTEPYTARELIEIVPSFDGVIAGDDEFSAAVLERATRLKVIVKWGIGVDAIDLEAARRLGIRVFNTPGVFAEEVADVVMGYVILLARQLHRLESKASRFRTRRWASSASAASVRPSLGAALRWVCHWSDAKSHLFSLPSSSRPAFVWPSWMRFSPAPTSSP